MNKILILAFFSLFFINSCGSSNSSDPNETSTGLTLKLSDNTAILEGSDSSKGILIYRDNTITSNNPAYITLKNIKSGTQTQIEGSFVKLDNGSIQQNIDVPSQNAKVNINYKTNGAVWAIQATIESLSQEDRGWELQFHLPISDTGLTWETGLNRTVLLDGTNQPPPGYSTWHPLTCLTDINGSLSLSIPISDPVMAGFSIQANELITKFSLGTSPLTKNKNKATIKMNVWASSKNGGFRKSLSDYYERHAEYFKRTVKTSGLWTTGTPERLKVTDPFLFHEHGNIFFSNTDSSAREYAEQIAIDEMYNFLTLPYLHIGQMSRINLDELPPDNTTITQFLENRPIKTSPQQLKKYNELYNVAGMNKWNEARALSSTLDANLYPNVRIRENAMSILDENRQIVSSWETIGKQISFVINPDPEIVNGHGENALKWAKYLLDNYPNISGIYVDSISGWPQIKNYKRDHFAFSDFPLASDESGNVYLPNAWGHIELLLELRALLHSKNKLLMGNGYRRRIDSHFLSSIVDVLGREDNDNINQNTLFGRTVSGNRPQVKLWSKVDIMTDLQVKRYINSSLALGVLPSAWGSYFGKDEWVDSDESFATSHGLPKYSLHEAHWLRLFKVLEYFKKINWEPETQAFTTSNNVHLERFSLDENKLIMTIYRRAADESDQVLIVFNQDLSNKININNEATDIMNDKKYVARKINGKVLIDINLDKTDASLAALSIDLN